MCRETSYESEIAVDGVKLVHMGVIPLTTLTFSWYHSAPRRRGGDPTALAKELGIEKCSPQARG